MRAWLAGPAAADPRAVGVRQGALLISGMVAMWCLPIGLSVAVPVVVGSWVIGAWWWAVQLLEPLPRRRVREVALRVGMGWGGLVGLVYGGVGMQPGALDLPWLGIVVVTLSLGTTGGLAAAALTLCGMDAGRAVA